MIQKWFEHYLTLINLTHLPKDSIQYRQLQQAFYSGIGSFMVNFTEVELSESEIDEKTEAICAELETFMASK